MRKGALFTIDAVIALLIALLVLAGIGGYVLLSQDLDYQDRLLLRQGHDAISVLHHAGGITNTSLLTALLDDHGSLRIEIEYENGSMHTFGAPLPLSDSSTSIVSGQHFVYTDQFARVRFWIW